MSTGRADSDPRVARLQRLARLLDARFRIPGTSLRLGLDGVLGLVPGIGDAATGLVSLGIVAAAARMGAPRSLLLRMLANVAMDTVVGAVPLVGDAFDIAFKANLRNLALLQKHLQRQK